MDDRTEQICGDSPSDNSGNPYAGFWLRVLAHMVDVVVLTLIMSVVSFFFPQIAEISSSGNAVNGGLLNPFMHTYAWQVLVIFYYPIMESSGLQATVGKFVVGLKVTDLNLGRISFWRAMGRHLAKMLSVALLGFGFILAGLTERKQGLHDLIARCLVVKRNLDVAKRVEPITFGTRIKQLLKEWWPQIIAFTIALGIDMVFGFQDYFMRAYGPGIRVIMFGLLASAVFTVLFWPPISLRIAMGFTLLSPIFFVGIHVYSTAIAAGYGVGIAILTFVLPGVSTLYWFIRLWFELGTPANPYCIVVFVYLFLLLHMYFAPIIPSLLQRTRHWSSESRSP